MKIKTLLLALCCSAFTFVNAQSPATDKIDVKGGQIMIRPIAHATMVLTYQHKNIYVDPVGGAKAFAGIEAPDMILITDIHGDHFDLKTLEAINTNNAWIIAPKAVADRLPATFNKQKLIVLNNGDDTKKHSVKIKAIPMYNLPEAADAMHVKGRGNGYVLTIGKKKLYISGDTEDIQEMRSLKKIDIAFVCMNLPYTMDVNQAAKGVLAFKPKIVYPYHHRGQDVNVFKSLVNAGNSKIDVRLRNWYPAN